MCVPGFEGCLEFCTVGTGDFVEGLLSQRREDVLVEVRADFVKSGGSEALFFFGLEPSFSSSSEGPSPGSVNGSFGGAFLFERIGAAANYLA
ncbi:hypothetical protein D3C80_1880890 [compost metagenome]